LITNKGKTLNKYLEQLVELSKYDSQISSFEPKIEAQKEKLGAFMQTANELRTSIDTLYVEVDDVKSKRIKNDIHLSELKDKLVSISKKNNEVQNEKELKALQLEEEIAKEQISFANEEISRLDALAEIKDTKIAQLKEKLKEEEESVKELQVAVGNEIEDLNKERNEVSHKRGELVTKIDGKILSFYEKIRRWAKDTAVVPVKKQACYGCFMKINDKTYAEVIKSEEIILCPHCGRILYKEHEDTEEA